MFWALLTSLSACCTASLKIFKGGKKRFRRGKAPLCHPSNTPMLAPDPSKTAVIAKMPTPTNVKALQEFLGMVQYLAKFLPHLSKITEPLRKLECKKAQWCWLPAHEEAIAKLKQMICEAPVLKYYDPSKQVSFQCDASERGLGYSLLQEGQPVAYGARGLTSTEQNYAQIEKEMLAIVEV